MTPEKLLDALTDIDSATIRSAHAEEPGTRRAGTRRFAVLLAAVIALVAMTATAFAAEEIAGWFQNFFARNTQENLSQEQIEYFKENEQIIEESQTHNGYSLELKSVLYGGDTIYATVGLTAPTDVPREDLINLWGSDIDFYDEHGNRVLTWAMQVYDDMDGLVNAVDLVFELNPEEVAAGNVWTLHIGKLAREIYHQEYEQELRDTKYAGQSNFTFTQEEIEKLYEQVVLAEGPWEFTIDLSKADNEVLELITEPVTAQICYGFKEDGTDLFKDVKITSFVLSPLNATIQIDCNFDPDFTSGDRKVYVVMKDGSHIQLFGYLGGLGKARLSAEAPIILDEVDHVLLADGTKLMVP